MPLLPRSSLKTSPSSSWDCSKCLGATISPGPRSTPKSHNAITVPLKTTPSLTRRFQFPFYHVNTIFIPGIFQISKSGDSFRTSACHNSPTCKRMAAPNRTLSFVIVLPRKHHSDLLPSSHLTKPFSSPMGNDLAQDRINV